MSRTITSASPETTRQLGQKLGALLQPGDLVCLQGDLGAGKTTFVQGLAAGWGSLDAVSSPNTRAMNAKMLGDFFRRRAGQGSPPFSRTAVRAHRATISRAPTLILTGALDGPVDYVSDLAGGNTGERFLNLFLPS